MRFFTAGLAFTAACGGGDGSPTPPPGTHAIAARVSGLTGAGLSLSVAVGAAAPATVGVTKDAAAAGAVPLASDVASGTAYSVAVATQPANPAQTCAVTGGIGSGTVGAADVVVAIACSGQPPGKSFTISGTVTGLTGAGLVLQQGGGDDLAVAPGASTFTFATRVAEGAAYAVTVKAQPAGQACRVANGAGTATADVTSVALDCFATVTPLQAWSAPTTWGARWPYTSTMRQHAWFDGTNPNPVEDPAIPAGSRVSWQAPTSAPPQGELTGLPSGTRWGAGPFSAVPYRAALGPGDTAVAALTGDMLVCAVVKPAHDPHPNTGSSEKGILARGFSASPDAQANQPGGGWVLHQMHDQFCFHYESTNCGGSPGASCMTMVYTPTYFGYDNGGGNRGTLDPSYVVFCGGRDGNTIRTAVNSLASVQSRALMGTGPLNPLRSPGGLGWPEALTLGGYPGGVASNAFPGRIYETAVWDEPATAANLAAKLAAFSAMPAGAIYVRNREGWLLGVDGSTRATWRNGPRLDPAKGMLFGLQGWNRLSTVVEYQSGTPPTQNEFHPWDIIVPGEDLGLGVAGAWTAGGGADVSATSKVRAPGDAGELAPDGSRAPTAPLVTLSPGASLTAPLAAFDAPGPIQALMWLWPVSTAGTLTVSTSESEVAVDLAAYPAGRWSLVPLRGLHTNAGSNLAGVLRLAAAPGGPELQFHAWGLDLTQLGGGGDLGTFDPGLYAYDWSAEKDYGTGYGYDLRYPVDALQLALVGVGSASGFCLAARARPFDGTGSASALAWDAPMAQARVIASWMSTAAITPPAVPRRALLYVSGATAPAGVPGVAPADATPRQLCFQVSGAAATCAPVPAGWAPGSEHRVAGCVAASGEARLFADDLPVGGLVTGVAPVVLTTGRLLVGNGTPDATWGKVEGKAAREEPNPAYQASDISRPWHGYVARVALCADPGVDHVAACR